MHLPSTCSLVAIALGIACGITGLCLYEVSCVLRAQSCVFHKPWAEAYGLGIIEIPCSPS